MRRGWQPDARGFALGRAGFPQAELLTSPPGAVAHGERSLCRRAGEPGVKGHSTAPEAPPVSLQALLSWTGWRESDAALEEDRRGFESCSVTFFHAANINESLLRSGHFSGCGNMVIDVGVSGGSINNALFFSFRPIEKWTWKSKRWGSKCPLLQKRLSWQIRLEVCHNYCLADTRSSVDRTRWAPGRSEDHGEQRWCAFSGQAASQRGRRRG